MAAKVLIFVSNRLQQPSIGLLCLMMMQMAGLVSSCQPEPTAMAARVVHVR